MLNLLMLFIYSPVIEPKPPHLEGKASSHLATLRNRDWKLRSTSVLGNVMESDTDICVAGSPVYVNSLAKNSSLGNSQWCTW